MIPNIGAWNPELLTLIEPPLDATEIIDAVSNYFGISTAVLRSPTRTQHVAFARQTAMYLLRKRLGLSFPVIGEMLGGRGHSTVMHAYRVIARRIQDTPRLLHGLL